MGLLLTLIFLLGVSAVIGLGVLKLINYLAETN